MLIGQFVIFIVIVNATHLIEISNQLKSVPSMIILLAHFYLWTVVAISLWKGERKIDEIVVVGHRKPPKEWKSCGYWNDWRTNCDVDHGFGVVRLTQSMMALEVLAWLL